MGTVAILAQGLCRHQSIHLHSALYCAGSMPPGLASVGWLDAFGLLPHVKSPSYTWADNTPSCSFEAGWLLTHPKLKCNKTFHASGFLGIVPDIIYDGEDFTVKEAHVNEADLAHGSPCKEEMNEDVQTWREHGYHCGHILAKELGGDGGPGNVFAQEPNLNMNGFREIERAVLQKVIGKDKYKDGVDLMWIFKPGIGPAQEASKRLAR